jgi:carotenoid cleavage dioxygenase-like enzyme
MIVLSEEHGKSNKPHPYLHGNFAPINRTQCLTPCSYTGYIPEELAGGEYVRNGGNPMTNEELGRDSHWFDGDGMLSGIMFCKTRDGNTQPQFVNQYILTDVYLSTVTSPSLRLPILPSIATLVNPASSLVTILFCILRTMLLVILSNFPGSGQAIKKISVANTGLLYHDGRALATCESGPPMKISLPGLETVGWFNGSTAEGESAAEISEERFGGTGTMGFMKEWTTAHPRVDPITRDLILFHSTFIAPFVSYSIIPSTQHAITQVPPARLVTAAVPGIRSAKMMHDFGVSLTHTVIMDLPLSLDPRNLARNQPVVSYDPNGVSRFGVFPRWNPQAVRWFETNPCCIFHTANTWSETAHNPSTKIEEIIAINMISCRLTSAALVFNAGDIAAPITKIKSTSLFQQEEEQCRLYYYRFDMTGPENVITHQFGLSAIPFEFPSIRDSVSMSAAQYIYGCSVSDSSFGAALGRAIKINCLVKIDARELISRAEICPPSSIVGCIDQRSLSEVLASEETNDPIKIFKLPLGVYAQESRFVARKNGRSEDDGWILSYVFDESQLDVNGEAHYSAKSELWVIEAKEMKEVVCKVKLPQRVPYGLHGNWFSEEEILSQRPNETIRHLPAFKGNFFDGVEEESNLWLSSLVVVRNWILRCLG